jgi:hypothetical protein
LLHRAPISYISSKVHALNRKVAAAPYSNLIHIPQLSNKFIVDKDQNLKISTCCILKF